MIGEIRTKAEPAKCVIIGAGPAGLTAGWELSKAGFPVSIYEQDKLVGGISRTEVYQGYRFDIGGHRFFTKVPMVNDWWMDILGSEFIMRPRLSRIYYNDRFFDYPLKPLNALRGLGVVEAVRCGFSYVGSRLFAHPVEKTLEQWVSNRFGKRLFGIFFKTYTEKVWGMKCSEISADWAAQRIKNLDLVKAVTSALLRKKDSSVTTLIEEFRYPRLGPGMMWERVAELLLSNGQQLQLQNRVKSLHHDGARVTAITVVDRDGHEHRVEGDQFLSTMPIRELTRALDPPPPASVLAASDALRYRDFLTVGLIVDQAEPFPDNWIYIHSPKVKVGRIQNFKSWSPSMVPDPSKSSLGLEYFVQENDEVWSASDADLIELGKREAEVLGLIDASRVIDGCVIRQPKAYPVYDDIYKGALDTVREWLRNLPNLQLIGRNGQHRYNNQDHSMVTAIYAARNIAGEKYDIWDVNVDAEYHEQSERTTTHSMKGGDRLVPVPIERDALGPMLESVFARYDAKAMGASLGIIMGGGLFLSTLVLLLRGGPRVGPTLGLLSHYFLAYDVTWAGAFVGLLHGCVFGFAVGWLLATLINAMVAFHLASFLRKLELEVAFDMSAGD
jgi:protoporphyrinogen oxidase